jgi:hypothetical protein
MEVYAEQSVVNDGIDKHSKRTKTFVIFRYACIAAIAVLFFLFWLTPVGGESEGWTPILLNFVFYLFMMVPFVLIFIMLGRIIKKTNVEYDYYLNGDVFRVVSVINRKKRKKLLETNVSRFESVGRLSADSYDRYAADKQTKKVFAFCDYSDEDSVVYIYYSTDGGRLLLHIQPDGEMLTALRRSVSRITVLDKSLNMTVKK